MRDMDTLLTLDYADMDADEIDAIVNYKANLMMMDEKSRLMDELTALKDSAWAENASERLAKAMSDFETALTSGPSFAIPEYAGGD